MIADAGGQEPRYVPMAVVDRIVGLNAAHVVLAALFRRERTGEGQSVELPMFETMTQFVLGDHFAGRTFDPPIGEAGNFRMINPDRRPYPTRDGYVCALIYTDKHWKAFFAGLGRLDQYEAHPHLAAFEIAPAASETKCSASSPAFSARSPPPRRWPCSNAATFPARRCTISTH